jgi:hypothetical protein
MLIFYNKGFLSVCFSEMGVIQEIAQAVEEMDWRCASMLVYYFITYITLKLISNIL